MGRRDFLAVATMASAMAGALLGSGPLSKAPFFSAAVILGSLLLFSIGPPASVPNGDSAAGPFLRAPEASRTLSFLPQATGEMASRKTMPTRPRMRMIFSFRCRSRRAGSESDRSQRSRNSLVAYAPGSPLSVQSLSRFGSSLRAFLRSASARVVFPRPSKALPRLK